MVEKLEPIHLHESSNPSDILVAEGGKHDRVLFWSNERGIVSYSLNEKKLKQNWPVSASLSLTSLAQDINGTYSCIFDEKSLCQWTDQHLNPFDGQVNEFSSEMIFRHHPVALGSQSTFLLVTKDGQAFLYPNVDNQESSIARALPKEYSARCLFSQLLDVMDRYVLISVICKDTSNYFLRILNLQGLRENAPLVKTEYEVVVHFPNMVVNPHACCILGNPSHMVVLDDSGVLYHGNIEPALQSSAVAKLSMIQFANVVKIEKKGKNDKLHSKAKLVAIDACHFAVVRRCDRRCNYGGVADVPRLRRDVLLQQFTLFLNGLISVYTSQFWACIREYEFELCPDNNNEESIGEVLNAEFCSGHVIVGTSRVVLGCPISVTKPSLASVIGTGQTRTVTPTTLTDRPVVLPGTKRNRSSFASKRRKQDEEELRCLRKLAFSDECVKKDNFTSALESYLSLSEKLCEGQSGSLPTVESSLISVPEKKRLVSHELCKNKEQSRNLNKSSFVVPQNLLDKITERILTEDSLWSDDVVERMIRGGLVSARRQTEFVEKLISKKWTNFLTLFLTRVRGLRESTIIASLRFALQSEMEKQSPTDDGQLASDADLCAPPELKESSNSDTNIFRPEDPEVNRKPFCIQYHGAWARTVHERYPTGFITAKCPVSNEVANLLNSILLTVGNESTLIQRLQDISLEETEILLDFLGFQAVNLFTLQNRGKNRNQRQKGRLTHSQVIDWITRVVNSKFASLAMSPKITRTLSRLQFNIRQELRTAHCLRTLQPFLAQLRNKQKLPKCNDERPYRFRQIAM